MGGWEEEKKGGREGQRKGWSTNCAFVKAWRVIIMAAIDAKTYCILCRER